MIGFRRGVALLLTLLLMVNAAAFVFSASAEGKAAEYGDEFFEGKTWDEIMTAFLKEHHAIDGRVGIGYRNLVTGEEHYVAEGKLFLSASTYKLPLNMYWSNLVYTGEIDWDYKIMGTEYSKVIEWSIVNSNNEYSIAMWKKLGNFTEFREKMLPLIGETVDTVEPMFYKNNYFTPRQLIYCLSELYANSESYPRVLELMLKAKPGKYFKEHEHEQEIAHKFGYLQGDDLVVNDCGIVFTDEPIALTVLTWNQYRGYSIVADYVDLMIAYTNYHSRIRQELEREKEAEEAARAALEAAKNLRLSEFEHAVEEHSGSLETYFTDAAGAVNALLTAAMTGEPQKTEAAEPVNESGMDIRIILALSALGLAVVMTVAVLFMSRTKRRRMLPMCLLLLAAAGGLLYYTAVGGAAAAQEQAPLPANTPEEAIRAFAAAPAERAEGALYDSIASGLSVKSCTLTGSEGNTVVCSVCFTYRDTKRMLTDASGLVEKELYDLRSVLESDDCNMSQSDISQRVSGIYEEAFSAVIASGEDYTAEFESSVQLVCEELEWKPVFNSPLADILSGKI